MRSKTTWIIVITALVLGFEFTYLFQSIGSSNPARNAASTTAQTTAGTTTGPNTQPESEAPEQADYGSVTPGTEEYRGFVIDNVLHSPDDGDIHYNVYIPESYDGSTPYA